MHLWYLLNPFGALSLEVRILYTFLKLVYDPYFDGTPESMDSLVEEATRLAKDIKDLQSELVADPAAHFKAEHRLEGAWSVKDIIKELFDLSGNFKDYLHGLVKIPSEHKRLTNHPEMNECTFKPSVNSLSVKLDQKAKK